MDLSRLFNPASIAVIGASQDERTISGQPIKYLRKHAFQGRVYAVNPKYTEVGGYPCFADIASLPETPDLAMMAVAAARVPAMIEACGRKGIRFVILFTAGFAEVGGEGIRLQDELAATARRYDIGIVGPNCQGIISTANDVYAGFGGPYEFRYKAGPLSLVSQSGGFGFAVANMAEDAGVGLRHIVSSGNEAVLGVLDFIDYFIDDPDSEVLAAYVEGLKDARRLLEVGRRALHRRKPILVWKVGNSEAGANAAASHTANLGGSAALYEAVFKQAGIVRVHDSLELADYAKAFQGGKLPKGRRMAAITVSGGAGVLVADELIAQGCEVQPLSPETTAKLRDVVPTFVKLSNPIDVTAGLFDREDMLEKALAALLDDPAIDGLAILVASITGKLAERVARQIAEAHARQDKPIVVWSSTRRSVAEEAYAIYEAARIPLYPSPVRAGQSLAMLSKYAAAVERVEGLAEAPPLVISRPDVRARLSGRTQDLSEFEATEVLAAYGIPVTRQRLARTAEEAAAHASELGFPVALKIQSPDIAHKTEAGGVRLSLNDRAAVAMAFAEIVANAGRNAPAAQIDGVLVQEMLAGGTEVILGVTNDSQFGPAVMFGLGGIFTEVLKDVTFRIAPVARPEVERMIREIRAFALLGGARGRPRADLRALADAIERLSALAMDLRDVVGEIDINPLIVFADGGGVRAVDALIKPRR
ncbi:MAG: acetate--CoA ligase family protein [Betaproteobacteria bacterium]|nr:acetate--CoA ligase family protein [Betaproteobacteria bacterium]